MKGSIFNESSSDSSVRLRLTVMPTVDNYKLQGGRIEITSSDSSAFAKAWGLLRENIAIIGKKTDKSVTTYCNESTIEELSAIEKSLSDINFSSDLLSIKNTAYAMIAQPSGSDGSDSKPASFTNNIK